ncbi:anti-phage dCTP deaminase [Flavobacterium sp. DGU11]|uniref:Anti-phage dCTP deaminase n=1 Tax=Flavobacterium arundinis TaxID=3139143 RepID=A0ABU9HYK0_9FLAO
MEARKLANNENKNVNYNRSTSQRVKETLTDEIVIGICSQIGAKKDLVISSIEKYLKEFNYIVKIIKLSDFITNQQTSSAPQVGKTERFTNLISKIDTGNELRENFGEDYLANLAITQIAHEKKKHYLVEDEKDFSKIKSRRICYIIDSIKHTEELNTFKDVYRDIFYLMSIYTPIEERINNLSIPSLSREEAETLIHKDQYEENPYGQQVREVFVNADFFLRVDQNTEKDIHKKTRRYINLLFGYGLESPTTHERAMYEAKSASVNSACLSRQVGAAITCSEGNLLSTGWNDVPKYGGNLYTSESPNDNRCFVTGQCHNDFNKSSLVNYIIEDFKNTIDLEKILQGTSEIDSSKYFGIIQNLSNFIKERLDKSGIRNLIEFSRSVHAEMHAIINAGNLDGNKIKGGVLYCTTYPCHNCARHIIAAGIKKVIYIEPYIKSKAPELHDDSITENEKVNNKVQLLVFDGVAPRRYLTFFNQNRNRKRLGKSLVNNFDKTKLNPINNISLQALIFLETQAAQRIIDRQTNEPQY